MAYITDESGQFEVFRDTVSERRQAMANFPKWWLRAPVGPDSNELFFQTYDGTIMVVTNETEPTFSPGIPVPVVEGPYVIGTPPLPRSFDISLDGQRLLMIKEATGATVEGPEIRVVLNWHQELLERVPID